VIGSGGREQAWNAASVANFYTGGVNRIRLTENGKADSARGLRFSFSKASRLVQTGEIRLTMSLATKGLLS
jgi:hypothetical protein